MKLRMNIFVILAVSLTAFTAAAVPQLPDPALSVAWTEYQGPEVLSIMITPDGSGDSFSQAFLPDGSPADAVVHLQLFDGAGNPVANFPNEDIWLNALDGGLIFCEGGNLSDSFTDANGEVTFSRPMRGGGSSQNMVQVYVSGMALVSSAGMQVNVNSPDLNGDLRVDLTDVAIFAADFFAVHYGGFYEYRSDFHADGIINLSDVTRLASSIGADCP